MSHVRYLVSPLARWLGTQKTHHMAVTEPAYWRAGRCLATNYTIRPIFARAYRGVSIEQLPSNALSKSIIIWRRHIEKAKAYGRHKKLIPYIKVIV
jgi:hypothetical protein